MSKLLRRIALAVAALAAAALLLVGAAAAYASHRVARRWEVPAPSIRAATNAAAIARGGQLFRSLCADCHRGAGGRVSGKHMADVPAFLGTFHSANITAHPEAGAGRFSDADLARIVRSGVLPDGRALVIMPVLARISDEDLAAVIGFMRSGDPLLAPDPAVQPRCEPSVVGKLILAFVMGVDPKPAAEPVAAPPRGPTVEYGRYLTMDVLDCGVCHTAGFKATKTRAPGAFAGGFELLDPRGASILSANVTPDPDTGIGRWSSRDLVRALRDGVRPDGAIVRPPMPRFRDLEEEDLLAIHAFLRTLPPVRNAIPRPARAPADPSGGAALFDRHGCTACHGDGAPFRGRLRAAAARSVDDVAARILAPERFSPGTQMPSYAGALDERAVRALAEYVRAVGAALPPGDGATDARP